MAWWDTAVDFVTDNWKPIVGTALTVGSGLLADNQRKDQVNFLREQAQADYERQRAERQAALAGGGGGGGGGMNTGAYLSAFYGAQAKQEAAIREALAFQAAQTKQAQKFLKPYREAGVKLLPKVVDAYTGGLGQLNLLQAYLSSPENMAKLQAPASALESRIPLPEHLRYGK